MKQSLTLLIILFFSQVLLSQEFEKRDFKVDPNDLSARTEERRTVNGEPAALIKVITNIPNLRFDSYQGIVGDVVKKQEGYWVYIVPRERNIRLFADGFLPGDFDLPQLAEPYMVFNLTVIAKGARAIQSDLIRITFRLNESNVYIRSGNNAPVPASGNNAVFNLSKGTHTFKFIKEGFQELEKTIVVENEQIYDISMVKGTAITSLNLPGFIIINSDPVGAEIYLNDQRVGYTPYQGKNIAGQYSIILKMVMYYEHSEEFMLSEGSTVDLPLIKLKPRFGFIHLNSEPSGIEVLLDGKKIGTTPLSKTQISSGTHEISLKNNLYYEHRETFTINDGDEKNFGSVKLKPAFGELNITSDPVGAEVFIDNQSMGKTPFNNKVFPSGTYQVRLKYDLYSDQLETIEVQDGLKTDRFIPLNKNFGVLKVTANEATIYINDRLEGIGNVERNLAPGQYRIRATKPLHKDEVKDVFIVLGQTEDIRLNPAPILGTISILSQPFDTKGAEIFLNGEKRKETTPAAFPLLIGTYKVEVKKQGYLDASKTVEIKEGQQQELTFDLQTFKGSMNQKMKKYRNAKIIYGSATLLAAGAGTYFRLTANQLSKDYETATTDATQIYGQWEANNLYSYIAFGAAVPLGVMTIIKMAKQSKAKKKMDVALIPLPQGGTLLLTLNF